MEPLAPPPQAAAAADGPAWPAPPPLPPLAHLHRRLDIHLHQLIYIFEVLGAQGAQEGLTTMMQNCIDDVARFNALVDALMLSQLEHPGAAPAEVVAQT